MLKYEDFLKESLAAQVLDVPKSKAMSQAEKMGLNYVGFGRFADNQGNIAYILDGENLVPYTSQQDAYSNYNKANQSDGEKSAELKKQANSFIDASYKRTQNDQKIMGAEGQEILKQDAMLKMAYNNSMFDSMEINTILDFISTDFETVNRYLYMGFDQTTDPELAGFITQTVNELDVLFEDSRAPFDYTVYTVLSARYNPAQIEAGGAYIFKGYVSASLDYNVCVEAATTEQQLQSVTLLQINITQGQKTIYTEAFTESGEMETLLPRGSKIGIISGPHELPSDVVLGSGSQTPITLFYCQLIEEV
jgi:hypothetical protein